MELLVIFHNTKMVSIYTLYKTVFSMHHIKNMKNHIACIYGLIHIYNMRNQDLLESMFCLCSSMVLTQLRSRALNV
jgi:hypothetical protein